MTPLSCPARSSNATAPYEAMDKVRDYTALNRTGWNAIAASRSPQPPEFFASGGSTLDDCEVAALGDVMGKRLLHLQCANGPSCRAGTFAAWPGLQSDPDLVDLLRRQPRVMPARHHDLLGSRKCCADQLRAPRRADFG